jgi:hypothetical protein
LSLPIGELKLYWSSWELDGASADVSCGDESKAPRGWRSRYYGLREPALSLELTGRGRLPCRLAWVFVLGPEPDPVVLLDRERIEVSISGQTLAVSLSGLRSGERLSVMEATLTHDDRVETLRVQ